MAELENQPIPSTPEQPPVPPEAVDEAESVRSHVGGLGTVKMSAEQKTLFDESAQLQNKIAVYLADTPGNLSPLITEDMVRVVEIAQTLSDRYTNINPAAIKTFHANKKPSFRLHLISFEAPPATTWPEAFNNMIDQIDPDNNRRFVS